MFKLRCMDFWNRVSIYQYPYILILSVRTYLKIGIYLYMKTCWNPYKSPLNGLFSIFYADTLQKRARKWFNTKIPQTSKHVETHPFTSKTAFLYILCRYLFNKEPENNSKQRFLHPLPSPLKLNIFPIAKKNVLLSKHVKCYHWLNPYLFSMH